MKKGWEEKKLGELCDLQNGFAFKSKDYVESSNTMNFRMSQIRPEGGIDLDNNPKYLPDEYAELYKDYLLNDGDIVIAMTDMATETKILGVPTIVKTDNRKLLLNQRVGKLYNINQDKIFIPFLRYMLTSQQVNNYYKGLGRGGLQVNIGKQDILNVKIPLPPLPEQKRLVKVLVKVYEKTTKAKENAEKNLLSARELFESYLQKIFADLYDSEAKKRLGEVCNIARGGSPRPIQEFLTTDSDGINWIKIGDATASGKYIYKTEEKIIPAGVKRSRIVRDGDFLLSNSMSFGRPYIMRTTGCIHDGWLVLNNISSHLDQDYLYYILGSRFVFQQFDRLATGSTVRNLNIGLASRVEIPVPLIKRQREIAQQFDKLVTETQHLEVIYKQKLNDLEELKKSILQKAFNGELAGACS